MIGSEDPGGDYFVPDEQLATFREQSVERRLRWLDETRAFVLETARAETRELWVKQRRAASSRTSAVFFPTPREPGQIPEVVRRRIDFLLSEARCSHPTRDQAVTYAMRVISNHATIGKDAGSGEIKRKNPRMSWAACKLRSSLPEAQWLKEVTNEHPDPLHEVWVWLKASAARLTAAEVWARFVRHPMITVTTAEETLLRSAGFQRTGQPQDRYLAAGIEPVLWQPTPAR